MNFKNIAKKVQRVIQDVGIPLVYKKIDDETEYGFMGVFSKATQEETSMNTNDPTKIIADDKVVYIGYEFPVKPVIGDIIYDRVRDPVLLQADFMKEYTTEWKVMKVEPYEAQGLTLGWKVTISG